MKRLAPIVVFIMAILSGAAVAAEEKAKVEVVETAPDAERVIKIEGTVEQPRVLFVVPRSRIWDDDFFNKSFIPATLKPVYPEALIEEWTSLFLEAPEMGEVE